MIWLEKQLTTEYKQDAEDCIKIYNKLKEISDGHVWNSQWTSLTQPIYKGFPSDERRYKPNKIGYIFLKGINNKTDIKIVKEIKSCIHSCTFFGTSMDGMECNHPYWNDKGAYENMIITHPTGRDRVPNKCPLKKHSVITVVKYNNK